MTFDARATEGRYTAVWMPAATRVAGNAFPHAAIPQGRWGYPNGRL